MTYMKKKTITLLLSLLCLFMLLAAYLLLRQRNTAASQEALAEPVTEPVLNIDENDVVSVSFKINTSFVTFQKADNGWTLKEDPGFPVDSSLLLETLSWLTPLEAVRTLSVPDTLSEYGLDHPQNIITLTMADGTETTLAIGNANPSTGDNYAMRNNDSTTLYTIRNDLLASISDNLYDYASGEELPYLMASNITGFAVTLGDNHLVVRLENNLWTVTENAQTLSSVSQQAVASDLSLMTGLSYQSYVEYNCTAPEQYGLTPPIATVSIFYMDDTETDVPQKTEQASNQISEENSEKTTDAVSSGTEQQLIFHIGTSDENGNYYVQQENSTEVHTLSAAVIDTLLSRTSVFYDAEKLADSTEN